MGTLIRWGILGAGTIARHFASDLDYASNGVLHGVASRTTKSAETLATSLNCKAYPDIKTMLADPDIDAIYIATPNSTHADYSIMALEADKAVLCEKPFCTSVEEAKRVAAVAGSKNLFCMEAMWTRFLPLIQVIRKQVDAGEIGPVRMIRAELGFPFLYEDASRLADPGGALLDLGVYGVSIAHHILGKPDTISAAATLTDKGVDEHMSALLGYRDAQAIIVASHTSELTNTLVIAGENGRIEIAAPFIQGQQATSTRFTRTKPQKHAASESRLKALLQKTGLWPLARKLARSLLGRDGATQTMTYPGHGYQFQAEAVGQALGSGKIESNIMPLDETIAVMETVDAIKSRF